MIIASRLFMAMGLFGLTAGTIYYLTNDNPELAGVGLLGAFFGACLYIGIMLWVASPANRRRVPVSDTGLAGSANPERGAADEQGNIHHMAPTWAPVGPPWGARRARWSTATLRYQITVAPRNRARPSPMPQGPRAAICLRRMNPPSRKVAASE